MIIFVFDTKEECDKFTFLYEKYHKMVFYTILRFIDDRFTAEDLLNEVYIRIGNNLDKINTDNIKQCQNYIITITRNYCKSYLRKQNRIQEDFIDDSDILKDTQSDILENLIERDEINLLMGEIAKLEDKYKMVLELKYINGLNDDEIATFLGIKKKNVQMRIYRAKVMLRERMGAYSGGK